jgi:pimeloyl-ACP methyl ester carboxylesterase
LVATHSNQHLAIDHGGNHYLRARGTAGGFRTRYVGEGDDYTPDPPPPGVFDLIHYAAPLGRNAAYVTPPALAGTSARKPAVIWVSGGFNWGIDRGAWTPEPRANDQSATTFLHAGIVLMRPSLRGRNGNPGQPECFVGEVDDIIAAGEYLRTRSDVDPNRIYLGGHSTGGTLALLTAASTDRFRAVFAFGAAHDARGYEVPECIPSEDESDEALVRAPIMWLTSIRTPNVRHRGRAARLDRRVPHDGGRGRQPPPYASWPSPRATTSA